MNFIRRLRNATVEPGLSCSVAFQYLLCFVEGQGQQTNKRNREKKHITKKLANCITSIALSAFIQIFFILRAQSSPFFAELSKGSSSEGSRRGPSEAIYFLVPSFVLLEMGDLFDLQSLKQREFLFCVGE